MTNFSSSILAGIFFILTGVWWVLRSLCVFYKSFKNKISFQSTLTYPPKCCSRFDIEGLVYAAAGGVGIAYEIFSFCVSKQTSVATTNMQHSTLYFFFGFTGLVSGFTPILKHSIPNIESVKYCVLLLAYISEAILLQFNLHDQECIDMHAYKLLVLTVYGAILSTVLEMYSRGNILSVLARACSTLLQGTWLCNIAFILYNPFGQKMIEESPDNMMLISLMFIWHIGAVMMFCITSSLLIAVYYRKQGVILTTNLKSNYEYGRLHIDYEDDVFVNGT